MKLHHTLAIGALVCAAVVTAALAQQQVNSSEMANSLAAVSGNNRLAMTGAQMRQAFELREIHRPRRQRAGIVADVVQHGLAHLGAGYGKPGIAADAGQAVGHLR